MSSRTRLQKFCSLGLTCRMVVMWLPRTAVQWTQQLVALLFKRYISSNGKGQFESDEATTVVVA